MKQVLLNDIGDPGAPIGSPAWCKYAHVGLRENKRRTQSEVSSLKYGLRAFKRDERWKQLTNADGRRFVSWEDYVQAPEPWGLGMRMDIAQAIVEEPDDRALLGDVVRRAEKAREIDAKDRANMRPAGRPKKNVTDENNVGDSFTGRPRSGRAYALRRLRKDRPDIHARVLAGELSPHAGMVEAGFRKKVERKKLTPIERLLKMLLKLTRAQLRHVRARIDEMLDDEQPKRKRAA